MSWTLPKSPGSYSPSELASRWRSVPPRQIPADIIVPRSLQRLGLATAADLPTELQDEIVLFLSLGACFKTRVARLGSHRCLNEHECTNAYVSCNIRELCQVALVCRRWHRLLEAELSLPISLNSRQDLLVVSISVSSGERYINSRKIIGKPDLIEQLRTPWMHHISMRLMPVLKICTDQVDLVLGNSGLEPLPPGQIVSSVHNALPRRLPRFSVGIRQLQLTDVKFKSFEYLVRLIKEMPSLQDVDLTRVEWNTLSAVTGRMPPATAFLARDHPSEDVGYNIVGCTNNRAGEWLAILIGLTRKDILYHSDVEALLAIAQASTPADISTFPHRYKDYIDLGQIEVVLTPRAGSRQFRRVEAVVVHFRNGAWLESDWRAIERQFTVLAGSALRVVLLVFASYELLYACRHAIAPSIPGTQLKLAFRQGTSRNPEWVQASLRNYDVHVIGEPIEGVDGWRKFL
ncbi:hypothetical protein NM688_g8878 [Phlebia brevispora]|uniref:Uncharacterized protein n=1 Tax=Phlebia brevispora TaxID=194682 RepID=A0ACC1RQI6_9APHY|nr:hypothetical protein NM688_g8878 [Phlebia brevispora]